ncbi:MAG: tetratricopeptide repeat protein [Blastocatellia bacterium]
MVVLRKMRPYGNQIAQKPVNTDQSPNLRQSYDDSKDYQSDARAVALQNVPLDAARMAELKAALANREYTRAETILVEEINRETARDAKSPRAAKLLAAAAGIFFLNGEFLNAAISYKKAEAIAPLNPRDRFTLAMAYIKLDRRDWARPELERLVADDAKNALYLYWLGRLDYDAQSYNTAIAKFRQVIQLDPQMARAYDNLGLCYDYLGQYDEAIKHYNTAIRLNRKQARPSAWPHLNLAVTLTAKEDLDGAENQLREALRYDGRLPQAHYHLGLVLEKRGKYTEAIESLRQAVTHDPSYAEPHYTMGLIYQRLGEKELAREEMELFQKLKKR